MNSKITLNQLAENIAKSTGSNSLTAKAFIQELTDIVTDALAKGKTVTIKGLGTFSLSDDIEPAVIWHPDETLAENVNQPFEAFEPIELEDGVTEEILAGTIDEQSPEPILEPISEQEPEQSPEQTLEPIPEQEPEQSPEQTSEPISEQEPEQSPEQTSEPISEPEPEQSSESTSETISEPELEPEPKSTFNPWLMLIVGILAGFIIGFFSAPYLSRLIYPSATVAVIRPATTNVTDSIDGQKSAPQLPTNSESADTLPAPTHSDYETALPTPVKPTIVTDTITTHRFLTTMARKYYGNYRFWVYIYLENSGIISDPNRIKPGTAVVIPPAEKYGIDASDPESVEKANEKIRAIMEKLDK